MVSLEHENLVKLLKNMFDKVYYEDQGDHYMFIIEHRNSSYILCLSKFQGKYMYGKLASSNEHSYLDCESIIYSTPTGLYIYAKDINEFLNKISDKLQRLKTRR